MKNREVAPTTARIGKKLGVKRAWLFHSHNLRRGYARNMRRILLVMAVTLAACSNDGASTPTTTDRACPATDVADRTEITQVRANLLLDYVEADAQRCAAELGWAYRVGMRDGESFAVTEDYSLQRVTVSIDDGVVTSVVVG